MTTSESITGGISIVAIVISIIAYLQNLRIEKRQLRIEKLEEMLEITHTLMGNYEYFDDTFFLKNKLLLDKKTNDVDKEKYIKQVKELIKISESINLQNKLTRLFVLNNSYLPKKKLKEKIGVLITIYTCIARNTISEPFNKIKLPFNDFPKRWDFSEFTQEIQNELIEEMDLGYKNSIDKKNTYDQEFKKRYNLK
ncbi:hypothetical protein ACJOV8_016050 [Formosa sp. 3Alg 14/1]|uniref:hypothetical protein n=1 Tax=Formosa sp. 3Alg 14/1 TaxID=3382190 RepID=UPI0039BE0F6B